MILSTRRKWWWNKKEKLWALIFSSVNSLCEIHNKDMHLYNSFTWVTKLKSASYLPTHIWQVYANIYSLWTVLEIKMNKNRHVVTIYYPKSSWKANKSIPLRHVHDLKRVHSAVCVIKKYRHKEPCDGDIQLSYFK